MGNLSSVELNRRTLTGTTVIYRQTDVHDKVLVIATKIILTQPT